MRVCKIGYLCVNGREGGCFQVMITHGTFLRLPTYNRKGTTFLSLRENPLIFPCSAQPLGSFIPFTLRTLPTLSTPPLSSSRSPPTSMSSTPHQGQASRAPLEPLPVATPGATSRTPPAFPNSATKQRFTGTGIHFRSDVRRFKRNSWPFLRY